MNFDVVIVGSGLAGQSVALHLADTCRVALVAKRPMPEGASDWAQGGIAAVLDSTDSVDEHVADTLIAGAGLCDEAATRCIVEHSRAAIEPSAQAIAPSSLSRTLPDARSSPLSQRCQ